MSEENREEVLADFQACTGIEDVAEAIYILEENQWDLLRAVNQVMPADSQNFQPNNDPDVEMVSDVVEVPASPVETATDMVSVGNNAACMPKPMLSMPLLHNHLEHLNSQPSTSSLNNHSAIKILRFNVQYNDKVIPIDIPDTGTVADIKKKIHKELKMPPCQQLLSGWARLPKYENMPLSSLSLPSVNPMLLSMKTMEGTSAATEDNDDLAERLQTIYTLKVTDITHNKTYQLNYPGTKTILEVKGDVFSLTNINVRHQLWTGWPENTPDQTMLALAGLTQPEHEVKVQQRTSLQSPPVKKPNNSATSVITIDSDDDEFEDASETFNLDEYFVDNETSKKFEPLIPEDVEDEIVGCITFTEQFNNRYGPIHPAFYQGTLEDAMKEACNKPAKMRKLLAVYLHHDSSVLSNVFCTQLLGSESVMQVIQNNFVLWGWDLTFQSNRNKLQTAVLKIFGAKANQNFMHNLWNIQATKLPAIVIITKIRSSLDIYTIVYGNVGVNELLSSLVEAVEVFSEHQKIEAKEEDERAERELVKWEQDLAYRESLEADRAKEEAKRAQEEAEIQEKQRVENEKAAEEARKEAHRKEVEASLPPEPPADQADIAKIRFRLPAGENLERRFLANTPLKVLLDFLTVKGYPTNEYKVISSWPRRDLTALDSNATLQDLKLYPQETVILEER